MPRFVARPIVVEAHQYMGHAVDWPDSFRAAIRRFHHDGTVDVSVGGDLRPMWHRDWLIRGPDGLFSVMKPAAFEHSFAEIVPEVARATSGKFIKKEVAL